MKKFLVLVSVIIIGVYIGYYYASNTPVQVAQVISSEVTVEPEPVAPVENTLFSFVPPNQPSINGTREENNLVLWKHLKDSANYFNVAYTTYMRVVLYKEVACNRDILIGINGKSMGVLHKNLSCQFMSDTNRDGQVLVMPLDSIQVVQNGETKTLNLYDYADEDREVSLSFAVGETDNFVTLIEVE